MQVYFTPEQEAQIVQAARATGTDAERLVKDAALQFVDDANFRATVLEAKGYADRGEFIEEEEMDARFEDMLRS
jgi:predicted transcriptional regulator